MADRITPRHEDFSRWYQDVILQAKLADYSPVRGCMVIRPPGYQIWEVIQRELDGRFQREGVQNAYFPLFIPESFLKKEAEHVEGFAPECAVVTEAGGKKLEEPLIVRPTSETIINSMFARWIQSYRDLPLKVNQWCNVVRWEMRTRLFLRTTEFLWQEGHTCHATAEESRKQALDMLQLYRQFVEDVLAIPVIAGQKSPQEKFAGALHTYTIEALMQDGKALQTGTSHDLSTHFAEAFETGYLDRDGHRKPVHQTSWGLTTRLIGALVMVHSDDRGLVLPPRVAKHAVLLLPYLTPFKKAAPPGTPTPEAILELTNRLLQEFQSRDIPAKIDTESEAQWGWRLHEAELHGTPIRLELGPRDLAQGMITAVRRDQPDQKQLVRIEEVVSWVQKELPQMQIDLLRQARKRQEAKTFLVDSYSAFQKQLEATGGFLVASWDQDSLTEAQIKEETQATLRCVLLDDQARPLVDARPALLSGKTGHNVRALFAKSY